MTNNLITRARALRRYIEQQSVHLDDIQAAELPEAFPAWEQFKNYKTQDRVKYKSNVYRCLQPHTAQATWTPDAAPSLWSKILIPDPDIIPDWEQPSSTNPYMTGDRVKFNGKIYESLIDNNVWSPADYPAGWNEVIEQ